MEDIHGEIRDRNIRSIAIPPLGSSLGGLNWVDHASRPGYGLVFFEPGWTSGHTTLNHTRMSERRRTIGLIPLRLLLDPFVHTPGLKMYFGHWLWRTAGEPLRSRVQEGTMKVGLIAEISRLS